jgi:hypothetical protein
VGSRFTIDQYMEAVPTCVGTARGAPTTIQAGVTGACRSSPTQRTYGEAGSTQSGCSIVHAVIADGGDPCELVAASMCTFLFRKQTYHATLSHWRNGK